MSAYENYAETSKKYDNARFAMAAPAVGGVVKVVSETLQVPLKELVAIDVGCGTGNYSIAMASMGVGTVHAVDGSEGMLEQLRAKVGDESDLAGVLHVGAAVDLAAPGMRLPFADGSIHVAVVAQVTHHLVKEEMEDPFGAVKSLLSELARVVAPGGAVVVQTQTPEQHRRGFWWADIIPVAVAKLARRFCDRDMWGELLQEHGLAKDVQFDVPPHPLVNPDLYADVTGPTRAEFRGWDSTWSLATAEELETGLKWYGQLVAAGRAKEYLKEREEIRAKVGQTTTVIAFKPVVPAAKAAAK